MPSHNGVPANNRAPNLKAYLCFEHYISWIAPWIRMGVTGAWQRMRQNIAGSWKSVTKRNSYTGDIYGQDIGIETLSGLLEGDVVLIIGTLTAYSTASPGTVSTGFSKLKVENNSVNEQYIELSRGSQSSYTLHHIYKVPANQNSITIKVNVDGFSHSIRVRDCSITAVVIGKG